jgi:uncharacterized pyridoxamine 5'-phosphate oxidase family protein
MFEASLVKLMYKDTLYFISADKKDTYKLKPEEELEYVDTIQEAVMVRNQHTKICK